MMKRANPSRPLRVGVEASALCSSRGPGRYLASVFGALAHESAVEFVPFVHDDQWGPWELPIGVVDGACLWRSRWLPWLNFRVPVTALRRRTDLVWFPANEASTWGCRPYVLTLHDVAQLHYPERFFPHERAYRCFLQRLQRVVTRAARAVTSSHYSSEDIIARTGVGPEVVEVIHLGVGNTFRPMPPNEAAPVLEALAVETPYLLFVGGFDFRKNLTRLIASYGRLVAQGLQHSLVLVGHRGSSSVLYPELASVLVEHRVADRVRVLDGVVTSDAQLRALYAAADVFVFPSLFEGFGLPPLEAMACGTPVVCSNAASLPEVVGDAAVLVDPCDTVDMTHAIAKVVGSAELRSDLRRRGLERARRFSWETAASALLRVFQGCA